MRLLSQLAFITALALTPTAAHAVCLQPWAEGKPVEAVAIDPGRPPLESLWAAAKCESDDGIRVFVGGVKYGTANDFLLGGDSEPNWLSIMTEAGGATMIDLSTNPSILTQIEAGTGSIDIGSFDAVQGIVLDPTHTEAFIKEKGLFRYSTSYASIGLTPFDQMIAVRFMSVPDGANILVGVEQLGKTQRDIWVPSAQVDDIAIELSGFERCGRQDGSFSRALRPESPSLFECVLVPVKPKEP